MCFVAQKMSPLNIYIYFFTYNWSPSLVHCLYLNILVLSSASAGLWHLQPLLSLCKGHDPAVNHHFSSNKAFGGTYRIFSWGIIFQPGDVLLQKLNNKLWRATAKTPPPPPFKYPRQTPSMTLGRCNPHGSRFPRLWLCEFLAYRSVTSTLIWACSLSCARSQNWRLTGTRLPKASEIQGGIGTKNLTNHWHRYFLTKGLIMGFKVQPLTCDTT